MAASSTRVAWFGDTRGNAMTGSTHAVLIAGIAGASLGTELAKCLRDTRYRVLGCDISQLAFGHFCDDFQQTFVVDPNRYIDDIIRLCDKHDIRFILPGGEQPTALLSAAAERLMSQGVRILGNDPELVASLSDKRRAFELLADLGVPIPLTRPIQSPADLDELPLPCILKPATGTGGSDSVYLTRTPEECREYFQVLDSNGRSVIAQQYIPLDEGEYTIGVLSLPNQHVVSCVCMQRLFNSKLSVAHRSAAGLVSSGYSQGLIQPNPGLEEQAIAIARQLGSTGPLNIQARVQAGRLLPFEINPRFSASTYLRAMAGVNEVCLYLDYLTSGSASKPGSVKPGYYLRSFTEAYVPADQI